MNVNLVVVDFVKSFPTIQPRTNLSTFGVDSNHLFIRLFGRQPANENSFFGIASCFLYKIARSETTP